MTHSARMIGLVVAVALMLTAAAMAQRGGGFGGGIQAPAGGPLPTFPAAGEFHFIRTKYTDLPNHSRRFGFASRNAQGSGWWIVDWPDADYHFSEGVRRLTRISTGEPLQMSLTDDRIFDNPWIYATQVGWWDLNKTEVARLGEYLRRGGFLVVDDFWSQDPESWPVFERTMARALPGQPITEMAESDSAMHVLYDIRDKDRTWIPGSRHLLLGADGTVQLRQPPGTTPQWFAVYDDKRRMVVAVNYNTDVGDAWEFADSPYYPESMTELAYRYGVNYIIYAMTH
jgi:Domain of unknown function (DUF4159)